MGPRTIIIIMQGHTMSTWGGGGAGDFVQNLGEARAGGYELETHIACSGFFAVALAAFRPRVSLNLPKP